MKKKTVVTGPELFPADQIAIREPGKKVGALHQPLRTKRKAHLIANYLHLFCLVAKHGTYIDAFTGPHAEGKPDTWAAKKVLENRPRWFRHFYLIESDPYKIGLIRAMVESQPPKTKKEPKRSVDPIHGDCNLEIPKLLNSGNIRDKAIFCLLDQHNMECKWSTVQSLAHYRNKSPHKIELFYFFGSSWFDRTIAGFTKKKHIITEWWGGTDWLKLYQEKNAHKRAEIICARFHNDLGYLSAKQYPIFEGNRLMYFMIHATDHADAPELMSRAYNKATNRDPSFNEQDCFPFMKTETVAG